MRVLIADDELPVLQTIGDYLELHDVDVDYAASGREAVERTSASSYDVIVLDVSMPRMSGLVACELMRAQGVATPILFLTARDRLDDKLSGFAAGADDYLVKPFAYEELYARLVALSNRTSTHGLPHVSIADLTINLDTREVQRGGTRLHLKPVQYTLLKILALKSPSVVPRSDLEAQVWRDDLPASDALRTHLFRLRAVLDKPFPTPLLHTVHGVGYQLADRGAAGAGDDAAE